MLLVDTARCSLPFGELAEELRAWGESRGLSVRIQHEDIFNAMHRI